MFLKCTNCRKGLLLVDYEELFSSSLSECPTYSDRVTLLEVG